jgi:hypothetical protein
MLLSSEEGEVGIQMPSGGRVSPSGTGPLSSSLMDGNDTPLHGLPLDGKPLSAGNVAMFSCKNVRALGSLYLVGSRVGDET